MARCGKSLVTLVTGAVLCLALVPVAAGATGGTDRPFMATLTGAATYVIPPACPPDCTTFTTNADATGEASLLGRVTMHSSHRPYDFDNHLDGSLILVAANGDKVYSVYDYDLFSEGPIVATLTGGTGRFGHASGTISIAYDVTAQFKPMPPCDPEADPFGCLDPDVPWPWSATMTGAISY